MKRKKEFIKRIIIFLVVTTLATSTVGLAYYYPQMEEEKKEKEVVEEADALPEWFTLLQRRDWMHSSGSGFYNLYPWNDNHFPRGAFPVSPIIHDRDTITLGEMFEHFWSCPVRRSHPAASHIKPGSEQEQRQAFRVWHATPGKRFHLDLVDGSSEPFPLSRWQTPHFQYAYVQYLHFNLNFCGNGLPSDVNHNFTRMNIMGSHYDRMFVFGGGGAGFEGHNGRYETLRNYLFPVSSACEVTPPHPSMVDVQPIYSNLVHPDGYIFGGWFKTLEQANNHGSEEGRMFERSEPVTTELSRTLFARWIPVEVPCDECDEEVCICEEVCEECEKDPCICDEEVCEECEKDPCICDGEVCEECEKNPCICDEEVCEECKEIPCTYEEKVCNEYNCESYTCEEECGNSETGYGSYNSNQTGGTNSPGNSSNSSNSSNNSNDNASRAPQTGDNIQDLARVIGLLMMSLALLVGLIKSRMREETVNQ